jgi:hypothetical protein
MTNSLGEIWIDNGDYKEPRNIPEKYRLQHLPKRVKNLDYQTIDRLMTEAKVKFPISIRDYLYHCYDENDALNSLRQLRDNRPEYFRKPA